MAEPITPLDRAIKTGDGFINDLLANIINICKIAFLSDEQLKPFAPRYIYASSPKKKMIEDLPSLHIWCNKVLPTTPSIGGQTGDPLTTHFQYFVNIEYVGFEPDTDQGDIDMNIIASALFDVINKHHNVNGIVNGPNRVFEILISDDFFAVGDSVKQLNKVTIHAVYHRSYKRPTATR